jgi:hypothetical protein
VGALRPRQGCRGPEARRLSAGTRRRSTAWARPPISARWAWRR